MRIYIATCLATICLIVITSCNNSSEPIVDENNQPLQADEILFPASDNTNNIKVIFSQLDSLWFEKGELGTFDVQIINSISLNGSLEEKFNSNSFNLGIGAWNLNGNFDKDIVIFIIIYDNINNKIVDNVVLNPKLIYKQNTFNKINLCKLNPILSTNGTIYAFTVDGIGDKPDAPIQINLYQENSIIHSLVLKPENSISPIFALHIDGSKKQTFFDTGDKSSIQIQHIISKNNTTKIPIPIYICCLNNYWNGNVVYSSTLYGVQRNEQLQRLDYYLFFIDL